MASSPMYRCRKPRILPRVYCSADLSSKDPYEEHPAIEIHQLGLFESVLQSHVNHYIGCSKNIELGAQGI